MNDYKFIIKKVAKNIPLMQMQHKVCEIVNYKKQKIMTFYLSLF